MVYSINRRSFLGAMLGAVAGATLDPERLLWEKGKKIISLPKPPSLTLTIGDIVEFEGFYAINPATRKVAINPDTGQPFLTRYAIVAEAESSHPMVFPAMIPAGPYKNVAMPIGFHGTNRPPRSFIKPVLVGITIPPTCVWIEG